MEVKHVTGVIKQGVVAPSVRDLGTLEKTLHGWLQAKMPQAKDLHASGFTYPRGAGLSHETILFDAHWTEDGQERSRGLVIRIKPTKLTVYQDDMFEEQYLIMEAMHRNRIVPIAEPLWIEKDSSIVGAPFFVMEKVKGRVPVSYPPYSQEGWLVEATPAQRRKAWEGGVRSLARIQRLPRGEVKFLDPENRFPDGFEQEWDRWIRFYAWVRRGRDFPFFDEVWSLLEKSRPTSRQPGLVWGDARIGNVMFDDQFNVVAVMDWEQISYGGALHDLGWWLNLSHIETEGKGLRRLDGMGSREEVVALWHEESGIDTSEIAWYERFAAMKLSLLGIRLFDVRGGGSPGMNQVDSPPVRALAGFYGLDRPHVPADLSLLNPTEPEPV